MKTKIRQNLHSHNLDDFPGDEDQNELSRIDSEGGDTHTQEDTVIDIKAVNAIEHAGGEPTRSSTTTTTTTTTRRVSASSTMAAAYSLSTRL